MQTEETNPETKKNDLEALRLGALVVGAIAALALFSANLPYLGACVVQGVIFGLIGSELGKYRKIGSTDGFLVCLFFSLIGLIIILSSERLSDISHKGKLTQTNTIEALLKLKELRDSGMITDEQFENLKKQLLNE